MRLQLVVTQMAIVRCNAVKLMYIVVLGYCEALQSLGVVANCCWTTKSSWLQAPPAPFVVFSWQQHLHATTLQSTLLVKLDVVSARHKELQSVIHNFLRSSITKNGIVVSNWPDGKRISHCVKNTPKVCYTYKCFCYFPRHEMRLPDIHL